jgi:hypothetical protein
LAAASPSAGFGFNKSLKRESRLGWAASEKHVNAILGRRHVPAVIKSRGLADLCHIPTLAVRSVGRKPFVLRLTSADGDNEWPKAANKILLGSAMLDQSDYFVGPLDRIIKCGVITVRSQEQSQRCERRPLVSLLKRMSACYTRHQRDRQHNDILFAECEEISWTGKSTLQKTKIADEMLFAGFCQLQPIVFYDDLNR